MGIVISKRRLVTSRVSYAHLKFKFKAGISAIMRLSKGGSIGHGAGQWLGKPDEKAGTSTFRGCESVIRVPFLGRDGGGWGLGCFGPGTVARRAPSGQLVRGWVACPVPANELR